MIKQSEEMHHNLLAAIRLSRDPRGLLKTTQASCLKLVEEVGELAEAILIEDGLLPHKPTPKEPPVGEAADIILMVMQTLSNHYPEKSKEEIIAILNEHLDRKLTKWVKAILEYVPPAK